MNIFASSACPVESAQALDDKRLVKMVLETAQLLSNVVHHHRPTLVGSRIYRPTHPNHPCSVWARENRGNVAWLAAHASALLAEYAFRYEGREHRSEPVIDEASRLALELAPEGLRTPFANCTTFKHIPDVHEAYRRYLAHKWCNPEAPEPRWTKRLSPTWIVAPPARTQLAG